MLPVAGQAEADGVVIDPDDLSAWAAEFFAEHLTEHNIPGAALVVVQDGEILLLDAYGEADPINGVPFLGVSRVMCKRLEFIDGEPVFKAQGELVQDERPLRNGEGLSYQASIHMARGQVGRFHIGGMVV